MRKLILFSVRIKKPVKFFVSSHGCLKLANFALVEIVHMTSGYHACSFRGSDHRWILLRLHPYFKQRDKMMHLNPESSEIFNLFQIDRENPTDNIHEVDYQNPTFN